MIDYASGKTVGGSWDYRVSASGGKTFLTYEDARGRVTRYTYAEFDERVSELAAAFSRQGVGPGDRVLYLCVASPDMFACLLALAKIGAALAPINQCATPEELAAYCSICRPSLVTWPDIPGAVDVDAVGRAPVDVPRMSLSELPAADGGGQARVGAASEDSLFEIVFTSGTTALPKAVEITHAHAAFACRAYMDALSVRGDDVIFVVMPLFHVDAVYMQLLPCIEAGASIVLAERYSASRFAAQCAAHGVTLANTVAMIVRTLLAQPPGPLDRAAPLRLVTTFMQLSAEEREAFSARFGARLVNCYGQTELVSPATMDPLFGPVDYASVGSPLPGVAVKIVDERGAELPDGSPGEICVRGVPGRTIMRGYFGDPERTAETVRDGGWLRTGDVGYVTGEGRLYLVDRLKNIIKVKGENVSAAEVEETIRQIPGVDDVAIIGIPHRINNEQLLAIVVGDGISSQDIIQYCQSKLTSWKIPSTVIFVPEIPLTPTGKTNREAIRQLYAQKEESYQISDT